MQISPRRQTQSALERGAKVGDDVAEQIVGNDDVERRRVLDQQKHQCIDIKVTSLDAGILRCDLLEHPLPQRVSLRHRVALVGHADAPAAVSLREFERVANDPVNALVGVHFLLDCDLVLRAGLEAPADADIEAFRVLPEHDEIDVRRRPLLERAQTRIEQLDGPVVDEQIQLEAGAEQDIARMPVVGHARIAEGADEDGVELAQHGVAVWRNRDAGLQKMLGAPRQHLEIELPSEHSADGLQGFHGFGGRLDAAAVPGNDSYAPWILSMASAIPIPPLTQSVARPREAPRRSNSWSSVTTSRAPVQPIGCPSAMAPPLTFRRSAGIGASSSTASTCTANASFSSMRSKSSMPRPMRSRNFAIAGTGPMPIRRGSTPALAQPRIFASGRRPRARAASADASTSAAPPSVMPDEVPAVMMPGCPSTSPNTGGSFLRVSPVVSPRGCSSRSTMVPAASPDPPPAERLRGPSGSVTGAISRLKCPASIAAFALRWLSSANWSDCSRVIPCWRARISAVSPMM